MSLGPLYILLGEVSVQVLCPFFNWIVVFLYAVMRVLYIFWRSNPCPRHHWEIYFPILLVPFHFADVFFSHEEAFYFNEVPFVYSFLCVPCSRGHIGENIAVEYLRYS